MKIYFGYDNNRVGWYSMKFHFWFAFEENICEYDPEETERKGEIFFLHHFFDRGGGEIEFIF